VFVLFDCVQFPRRGWVHRNRFATAAGHLDWLTLPLLKCPRETRIDELAFAPDAGLRLATCCIASGPRRRRRAVLRCWIW